MRMGFFVCIQGTLRVRVLDEQITSLFAVWSVSRAL